MRNNSAATAGLGGGVALWRGPSPDGGYWLVGARAGLLVRGLFDNVRWSTAFALSDTLNNIGMKKVVFVDTLNDIDSVEDFVRWST